MVQFNPRFFSQSVKLFGSKTTCHNLGEKTISRLPEKTAGYFHNQDWDRKKFKKLMKNNRKKLIKKIEKNFVDNFEVRTTPYFILELDILLSRETTRGRYLYRQSIENYL